MGSEQRQILRDPRETVEAEQVRILGMTRFVQETALGPDRRLVPRLVVFRLVTR